MSIVKNKLTYRFLLMLALAALLAAAALPVLANGGRPLGAMLNGPNEVPVSGDPDGSGWAHVTLNQGQNEVCWHIQVEDITLPARAAHIHSGAAGVPGGVVVGLSAPDADGVAMGCTSADSDLIKGIRKNPGSYYVNVHNADYPGGALRGQLFKLDD